MRTEKTAPELVLKATAPRVRKGLLLRQELRMDSPRYLDKTVVAVHAPAGCGKTALLGQWRRESLMRAADVAWLTVDERDEPVRFVQGVLAAMRLGNALGAGDDGPGAGLLDEDDALDALTSLLATIASQASEVVLFLDDVHFLPPATLDRSLPYLLLNAPSNLRLVLASRIRLALPVSDRLASGEYAEVTAQELHFRLEETMAVLRARLGDAVDADAGALLHERTEGWPLGVQLAISTIQKSEDPGEAIRAISGGGGDLQTWFVEALHARLRPEQAAFLVRICLVQAVTPALSIAITGDAQAGALLLQLCESTPIFADASGSEWLRFHPLTRDFLLPLFEQLPEAERRQLRARASAWLAGEQLYEEAAQLALAAGQEQLSYDLAERCMYELNLSGQVGRVLEWLERLPESEVMRRPRLRIAAAWALALGGQHERARALVAHIYADRGADVEDRCESAAVCSAAAIFADRLDEAAALVEDWSVLVPPEAIQLQLFLAIQQSQFCLYRGDPERARYLFLSAPHEGGIRGMESNRSYGDWLVGTSYLVEGQVRLAEGVLRPALAHAERLVGRRSQVGVTLAAALAASLWERNQTEAVAALLANRLDAIERLALPEIVAGAYALRARWLALHGQEHRAFDLLGNLHSLGERRRMPRLCLVSLGEQIRMHAVRNRRETCAALFARLERAVPASFLEGEGLLGTQCSLLYGIAEAYHALAAGEHEAMLAVLDRLVPLAERLRRGGDSIRIQLLRALAIDRGGGDGHSLFLEATSLAETYGLARVVVDTHPELAEWAPAPAGAAPRLDAPAVPRPGPPRVAASALLTAKEGEILSLLAGNLSNKQIARTLDVREDTIKWHLKNLFGKLHVSSRRQAVQQARLVGLLDDGL